MKMFGEILVLLSIYSVTALDGNLTTLDPANKISNETGTLLPTVMSTDENQESTTSTIRWKSNTNRTLDNALHIATNKTRFRIFDTITLTCECPLRPNSNITWLFRYYRSFFVTQWAEDFNLTLNYFDRFENRYITKETTEGDKVIQTLEIMSALPGDKGWYTCIDVNYDEKSTVFVDFLYDNCRDDGIFVREYGCFKFLYEDECLAQNGSLVTVHTWQKNRVVYDLAFHEDKAEREFKIGLQLSANSMLWKDFVWADGSSLSYIAWFGPGIKSCYKCLHESTLPVDIGMEFHFNSNENWEGIQESYSACEWPVSTDIAGLSIPHNDVSYNGPKVLFQCESSREYISTVFVCDKSTDCIDGSDEDECDPSCAGKYFQCHCGGCIPASNVCDFYKDCVDGSDEESCHNLPCPEGYWECATHECIPVYDLCDGEKECADGSDESDKQCKGNSYAPTEYTFLCNQPDILLPASRRCDGIVDCSDTEDEDTSIQRCLLPFYSCNMWVNETGATVSNTVGVNFDLVEYGKTAVACNINGTNVSTIWPFSGIFTLRTFETYSGQLIPSKAVWINVLYFVTFTPISYTNAIPQNKLLSISSECVQYIRACRNVMSTSTHDLIIDWTNDESGKLFSIETIASDCSGFCTDTGCKMSPSFQNGNAPTYFEERDSTSWIPITNKDQLPIRQIRSSRLSILGISPLECKEDTTKIKPIYKEKLLWCKNGIPYYPHQKCLLDFDPTGEPKGCRDLTHLENCETCLCPKDYVKCPGSFCLHIRYVCDGRSHCPNQEDEAECETNECRGFYRCRGHKQCIPFDYLCDGIRQCPRGDDEQHCSPICPKSCVCNGLTAECKEEFNSTFIKDISSDTRWMSLKTNLSNFMDHIPLNFPFLTTLELQNCSIRDIVFHGISIFQNMTDLRLLDLSSNKIEKLGRYTFHDLRHLQTLILRYNPLKEIDGLAFNGLNALKSLDMSHGRLKELEGIDEKSKYTTIFKHIASLEHLNLSFNLIEEIQNNAFGQMESLTSLVLNHNPIMFINTTTFTGLLHLENLHLENTQLVRLQKGVFLPLRHLINLNVSGSKIQNIEQEAFVGLGRLITLDIQNNDDIDIYEGMFKGLDDLEYLYTDSYKMCCIRPRSVASENCFAPKELISSCSNLIALDALRIFLWIIGVTAVIGNVCVLIYRFTFDKQNLRKSYSIFVINLSISDFLMGFYMMIIAAVDTHYSGKYVTNDKQWRHSSMCAAAGMLSTISSEMSTFVILLITIDRFVAIVFPLSRRNITWRKAIGLSILFWTVAFILALIPQVFFQTYFQGQFYSRSGVCLALPLTDEHSSGEEYAVGVFIGLNSLIFILILIAQIYIYKTCKGSGKITSTLNRKRDIAVARSLFLVVATDFCCWFPIGVIGVWSQAGGTIPPDVYAWIMVFVLPINSAINPFLYTYTYVKRKRAESVMKTNSSSLSDKRLAGSPLADDSSSNVSQTNALKAILFNKVFQKTSNDLSLELYLQNKRLSPAQAFQLAKGTMDALLFLHNRNIIHGKVDQNVVFFRMKKEAVMHTALIIEETPLREDADTSNDIQQFGLLIKKLLRRLDRY